MIAAQEPLPRLAYLEQSILHRIAQRTAGRIRALEVKVRDDRVVIRGHSASFHLKQLAIQSVLDVLGSDGAGEIRIDIQIEVDVPKIKSADSAQMA